MVDSFLCKQILKDGLVQDTKLLDVVGVLCQGGCKERSDEYLVQKRSPITLQNARFNGNVPGLAEGLSIRSPGRGRPTLPREFLSKDAGLWHAWVRGSPHETSGKGGV